MSHNQGASEPIVFNAIKHHARFLIELVHKATHERDKIRVVNQLKHLGASTLDFYVGQLKPQQLISEIRNILTQENLLNRPQYHQWVLANGGFQQKELSDGSSWTLRYLNQDSYIHIHPSRYSKDTLRVHANSLKTVVSYLLFVKKEIFEIELANQIRQQYLGLSQVKQDLDHRGLEKLFNMLVEIHVK